MPVKTRNLFGRRKILSSVSEITRDNVVTVLTNAKSIHQQNSSDIDYLYNYYKGRQPILGREKQVRPEINNRLVENRANQIVSFKAGYLCGEPIQYVGRRADEGLTDEITRLNEMMAYENKAGADQALVEWSMICGTSYRMVLPDPTTDVDEAPFEVYTLDPRGAFVVYNSGAGNKPLMSVKVVTDEMLNEIYSIYTPKRYFEIVGGEITVDEPHALGAIPIVEYPANNAMLGAFEIVLPLLDALNETASNRLDGIQQFVQSFFKFVNCDIDLEQFGAFREQGVILIKSIDGNKSDVDLIASELNQDQTQTYKNDIYQSILTICGMPNRNGGSSTSDTGAAVIMRDGWEDAEARAKSSEEMFKMSEREMLKIVLRICRDKAGMKLRLSDIDMKFTRRNYENIQAKAQVLTTMLQSGKIHPKLAFEHCGMFADSENAYQMSIEWRADQLKLAEQTTLDQSQRIDPPAVEAV